MPNYKEVPGYLHRGSKNRFGLLAISLILFTAVQFIFRQNITHIPDNNVSNIKMNLYMISKSL